MLWVNQQNPNFSTNTYCMKPNLRQLNSLVYKFGRWQILAKKLAVGLKMFHEIWAENEN